MPCCGRMGLPVNVSAHACSASDGLRTSTLVIGPCSVVCAVVTPLPRTREGHCQNPARPITVSQPSLIQEILALSYLLRFTQSIHPTNQHCLHTCATRMKCSPSLVSATKHVRFGMSRPRLYRCLALTRLTNY